MVLHLSAPLSRLRVGSPVVRTIAVAKEEQALVPLVIQAME